MLALYTKNSFFDSPLSKGLTRYPKIPLGCLFQCKDLLNFTCHNIEFHNCHHTNVSVISVHFLLLWEDLRSYIGMLYWQFLATTVHCNCSIIQDIVNAKKKKYCSKKTVTRQSLAWKPQCAPAACSSFAHWLIWQKFTNKINNYLS